MANKQDSDTHFFNSFSMVLGILVAIAIALFVFARYYGTSLQAQFIAEDKLLNNDVSANIQPVAHVAIAGQDNSALAKLEPAAEPAPAADVPANGEAAYQKMCQTCHATGVGGAPKVGDHAAWAPRIAQGKDTLYKHAIVGFQGSKGVMPAKGGTSWPDDIIKAAVDHMVSLNK
ncbi:MAG: c-type cytochrome [Steroidobacteraceae bacterium]